ncbi:MAG: hypothetical protein KGH88_06265 [Thaumarchaeota archaeon]|nr:hypothetical protein [Nitrososphaerota archaeon]
MTSVTLKDKDRTMLKTMIDDEIAKIPGLVRNLRLPEFSGVFQIKDESEYVYGYTHGSIIGKFETYYFVAHSGKKPSGGEIDEIAKTIFQKTSEIRNAIIGSVGQ